MRAMDQWKDISVARVEKWGRTERQNTSWAGDQVEPNLTSTANMTVGEYLCTRRELGLMFLNFQQALKCFLLPGELTSLVVFYLPIRGPAPMELGPISLLAPPPPFCALVFRDGVCALEMKVFPGSRFKQRAGRYFPECLPNPCLWRLNANVFPFIKTFENHRAAVLERRTNGLQSVSLSCCAPTQYDGM